MAGDSGQERRAGRASGLGPLTLLVATIASSCASCPGREERAELAPDALSPVAGVSADAAAPGPSVQDAGSAVQPAPPARATPGPDAPPEDVPGLRVWLDTPELREIHAAVARAPEEAAGRFERWTPAPDDPPERATAVRLWGLRLRLDLALATARKAPAADAPAAAPTEAVPRPEVLGPVRELAEAHLALASEVPLLAAELRLEAARTLSEAGSLDAALTALQPLIGADGAGDEAPLRVRAATLAVRLHLAAGRRDEAVRLGALLPEANAAPDLAWLRLELGEEPPGPAETLALLRRHPGWTQAAERLANLPARSISDSARVELAEAFWEAGRTQTARMALAGLGGRPWSTPERCRAGLILGLALERSAGRKNLAAQEAASTHLAGVAASCDGDVAARATFVAGRNRARAFHREKTPAKRAAALDAARALLTRHITAWPRQSTVDDAASLLVELEPERAPADALRLKVLADHPRGDMAEALAWGYVWPSIEASDWPEARRRLEEITGRLGGDVPVRHGGRLDYWLARSLAETGEADAARARFEALLRAHPLSFYAVLALSRRCGLDEACGREALSEVVRATELAPLVASEAWRRLWAEPAFRRAVTWARVASFADTPDAPFLDRVLGALDDVPDAARPAGDGWVWARAGVLQLAGAWSVAMGELRPAEAAGRWSLPSPLVGASGGLSSASLWARAYPLAFEPLVRRHAEAAQLPGAWIWAIARTESNFNPRVVSWANAVGLMQILPSTAEDLARGTNLDPTRRGLEQPDNALALGTKFLARLLGRHRHIPLASAGYNAGSGAVGRWRKTFGALELDRFVEAIPYQEAHNYAKSVTQSMARYRWLHEGQALLVDLSGPVAAAPPQVAEPEAEAVSADEAAEGPQDEAVSR
jgi:soluble lytic murein transglycosylase-like protein